jgi:hypothetical protein
MNGTPEARWTSRKLLIGTLTVQVISAAVIIGVVFFPSKEKEIRTVAEAIAPMLTTIVALLVSAASGAVYMHVEGKIDEAHKKSEGEAVVAAIESNKSPIEVAQSVAAVNLPPVIGAEPSATPTPFTMPPRTQEP